MKILVVEDEERLRDALLESLRMEGYLADGTGDGESGLDMIRSGLYDLVLLDIMLPRLSGIDVLTITRKLKINVPIILLTAMSQLENKIEGMDSGADDYITKPFNILEVKARIKAIMRRTQKEEKVEEQPNILTVGEMRMDCEGRRVFISGKEINLTAKEFDVLELLVKNPNKVYSRENLLNLVWGYEYPGDVRTVDVHIRRLREKIETTPSDPRYVHTKWGVGYYFQLTNK